MRCTQNTEKLNLLLILQLTSSNEPVSPWCGLLLEPVVATDEGGHLVIDISKSASVSPCFWLFFWNCKTAHLKNNFFDSFDENAFQ